jgi:hypothetical protein
MKEMLLPNSRICHGGITIASVAEKIMQPNSRNWAMEV